MRFYLFLTILVLGCGAIGCGGGGGGDNNNDDYFNRVLQTIPLYVSAVSWESWVMGATLEGNDDKDHSFIARLVIKRDADKIYGFGNANGYPLGNFVIRGTRTGDNLVFEIISQNRYRAFKLEGRGIYINSGAKIGGNRLEGSDFWTVYDDSIDYSGNFNIEVTTITPPIADGVYNGRLDGAYNSIENGDITFEVNDDKTILNISSFQGGFVGENQSEGVFNINKSSIIGDIEIEAFSFRKVAIIGDYTLEIDGAISGSLVSGFVIIQRAGKTYVGAFTAISE